MTTSLIITPYSYLLNKFTMLDFEVDGISYVNPRIHFSVLMFSFKDEFDDNGNPADTGGVKHRWNPEVEVSDKHWLKCGVVTYVGNGRCPACDEVT